MLDAELDLHPDAKRNFDTKAGLIASSLAVEPPIPDDTTGFPIQPYVTKAIKQEDIVPESLSQRRVDHSGREIARYFEVGANILGLVGENHSAFWRLGEDIQRTKPLRDKVSLETILDLLTDWLRARHKSPAAESASEFVLAKSRPTIGRRTVLLPLYELYIEEPLEIGNVLIRTITSDEISKWIAAAVTQAPDQEEAYQKVGLKWRNEFQGKAAIEVTVTAEPKRAAEIARERAEDALAMLQVFSIATLLPEGRCYWTLLGSEKVVSFRYMLFDETGTMTGGHSSFYRYRHTLPMLNKTLIAHFRASGLTIASELLRNENRNAFQDTLLESLLLYSRSTVQDDLAEKLLYIIVALETVLVRNDTEPLQQNIAERVAFTIAQTAPERRAVIGAVRTAYGLRSSFVHHGAKIDDLEAMEAFMGYALTFFMALLKNVNVFSNRIAFLDFLEERKLS